MLTKQASKQACQGRIFPAGVDIFLPTQPVLHIFLSTSEYGIGQVPDICLTLFAMLTSPGPKIYPLQKGHALVSSARVLLKIFFHSLTFWNPADRGNTCQGVSKDVSLLLSMFSSPFLHPFLIFPLPSLPPVLLLFLPLLQLVRARSPLQPKGIGGPSRREQQIQIKYKKE